MYARAEKESQTAARNIESAGKRIEQVSGHVQGFAQAAAGALATLGIATGLKGLLDSYIGIERGQIRLTAAIESNRGNVEQLIPQYRQLAEAISETTLTTRGEVMSMAQRAEMYGATGAAAERAIRNAIALASATGQDAESMLRATVGMEQGNVQMLRRIPGLRGIHDQTQLVTRANQMMAAGMRAATAESESLGGQIHHMWEDLKRITKPLGEDLASITRPVVAAIRGAMEWFNKLDPNIKRTTVIILGIVGALAAIGPTIATLAPFIGTLTAGFGIAAATAGLILSPLALLLVPLGIAAAATYKWVQNVGGLGAAWEIVREKAGTAWDWIELKALQAYAAIKPGLDAFVEWAVAAWETVGEKALAAWDWIKQKAAAFYDWARPIAAAYTGFIREEWNLIVRTAEEAWEFIRDAAIAVWGAIIETARITENFLAGINRDILGDARITWRGVRDFMVETFIFGEFVMTRFGSVWGVLTTRIAYLGSLAFDSVKTGFLAVAAAGGAAAGSIIEGFRYAWRTIQGQATGSASLGQAMARGLREGFDTVMQAGGGGESAITRMLRRDYETQARILGESFAAFRARRLAEIGIEDNAETERRERESGRRLGDQFGGGFANAAIKQIEKFDAALIGSSEHMTRLFEYRLRLQGINVPARGGAETETGPGATAAFNAARGAIGPGGAPNAPTIGPSAPSAPLPPIVAEAGRQIAAAVQFPAVQTVRLVAEQVPLSTNTDLRPLFARLIAVLGRLETRLGEAGAAPPPVVFEAADL